jgi:two-component system CheB/CheR fusion protein
MQAHLFEPFAQAPQSLDRSRGGLGLGLAMVKGLIDLHGGTVQAASAGIGRGAEFSVRLPLIPDPAKAAPPAAELPRGPKRRVVVIEDNVDAADSLRVVLALQGDDVQVAYDGPAGLALAREARPDVVICDLGLPGMDGYEVARAIRGDATLRDTYLVALSGYARPEDSERAAAAGFDHHIAKPPSRQQIAQLKQVRRPGA